MLIKLGKNMMVLFGWLVFLTEQQTTVLCVASWSKKVSDSLSN